MYHKKGYRKLGMKSSHRMSMLNNMVASVIEHGAIVTTETRAKTLRPYLERMLTKVKNNLDSLAIRREVLSKLGRDAILEKLYKEVIGKISNRNGGYTRITKIYQRSSDATVMAKIELIDESVK